MISCICFLKCSWPEHDDIILCVSSDWLSVKRHVVSGSVLLSVSHKASLLWVSMIKCEVWIWSLWSYLVKTKPNYWYNVSLKGPLQNTVTSYKNTLPDGKRPSETLKRKDVILSNDVISLYFLPFCVVCHQVKTQQHSRSYLNVKN